MICRNSWMTQRGRGGNVEHRCSRGESGARPSLFFAAGTPPFRAGEEPRPPKKENPVKETGASHDESGHDRKAPIKRTETTTICTRGQQPRHQVHRKFTRNSIMCRNHGSVSRTWGMLDERAVLNKR